MKTNVHDYQINNFKIAAKKIIIAALLVVSVSAFAQDNQDRKEKAGREQRSPEARNEARMKKMTTDLNLNDSQQAQMKQLFSEQMKTMNGDRGGNKDSQTQPTKEEREARQQKRQEEKTAMDAKIKNILTPAQFEKYTAAEVANKSKMQGQGQRKDRGNKEE